MRSNRLRLIVRHLRACARHVSYNLRCVAAALCHGEIREVRPLCEEPDPDYGATARSCEEPDEGVTHPMYLCRCACGRKAAQSQHEAGCLWAAQMCGTCEGHGWCPRCLGDGTAPIHQTGRACA